MFGYIRLQEDQLRLCDLKTYRRLYCSLCRQIGRYSQLARFFLSFDMLFFAILSGNATSKHAAAAPRRHCLSTRDMQSPWMDYWAGMSILMIYHKLKNDVEDGSVYKTGWLLWLKKAYQRIKEKYPKAEEIIAAALKEISKQEQARSEDSQRLVTGFGQMLAEVLSICPGQEDEADVLAVKQQIAFRSACWLYCMDIFDDVERDRKKGQYNPLLLQAERHGKSIGEIKTAFRAEIRCHVQELQRLCGLLPYGELYPIIRNALQDGVAAVEQQVFSRGGQ